MTWWTSLASHIDHTLFVTVVALSADDTVVSPDLLLPWLVVSHWTLVLLLLVIRGIFINRTVVALWTLVVVTISPFTDVSRLTTSTVALLTLGSLHTHGLIWAVEWLGQTTWAVLAFWALVSCWVW